MLSALLSILLLLLKIIGIILLLILAVILIILLVPVRYEVEASSTEEIRIRAGGKVTWLLSLIHVHVQFAEKELIYYLKILGIKLVSNEADFLKMKEEKKRKKQEKKKKVQSKKEEVQKEKTEKKPDSVKEESLTEKPANEEIVTESKKEKAEVTTVEEEAKPSGKEEQAKTEPSGKKEKKDSGIKDSKKKDSKKTDSDQEKVSLSEKIDGLKAKIQDLKDKAEEYEVLKLISLAKKTIFRILKHVLPRHLEGYAHYGFEDPSLTGKITAGAAVFYPVYGKTFSLEPDFVNNVIEGDVKGSGKIRLGFFVWILITLLLKKEVRRCIRLVLKK